MTVGLVTCQTIKKQLRAFWTVLKPRTMGNENSQPVQPNNNNAPNPIAETARNLIDKIRNVFNSDSDSSSEEERPANPDSQSPNPIQALFQPKEYPKENWQEMLDYLPLEILYSIFYYLELNFKNVISLRLVSKRWSDYIFSRIPMDLDASFISFRRLSFLPLISGLKVAGFGLNSAALQDIIKITSLEKLYIGHDKAGEVSPNIYHRLNKLQNLRDLALVNLHSLPSELDVSAFGSLNKLEISGTHANVKINGLFKLNSLKTLILMRQSDTRLLPLSHIASLTALEYLHLFNITNRNEIESDQMGLEKMKNLKTLKLAGNNYVVPLPVGFYVKILQVEHLSLTSFRLPSTTMGLLENLKQLVLFEVSDINQDELFQLPNLEILKLTFESSGSCNAKLQFKPNLTEKCKKLRELVLSHCSFSEDTCKAITKLPNLEYLSVPYASQLELSHVYQFAAMNCLKTLNLSYNVTMYWVTVKFYPEIAARARTLRTVYLIGFTKQNHGDNYNIEFIHSR